ncbi:MAG: methyltransferase domain-containing protein [Acidobacteriia bacterium]|nr:methyltransferase domain-containing protein [Methyloceanibacter sp.]MBX5472366.1 methyltransferase domain-containing protein [Acetobacteraceae bacterium]MCL6491796.1 methyltransferase domain-containing protein [Terriglobia bacterium]
MAEPLQIFDRRAVRLHKSRASRTIESVKPILAEAAERLLERLDPVRRSFQQALDIGGRGVVAPMLQARGIAVFACDPSPEMARRAGAPAVAADEEWFPFAPASFDLIVANLSLHWVNDLPGTLLQIRHALRPEGLFLASLPIVGTLAELRRALTEAEAALSGGVSPRISPLPTLRDCAGLLQRAGFAMPVADLEEIRLLYANPMRLLADLRAGGETNALAERARKIPPRALFPLALSQLQQEDGRIPVTLRLAMLTGWNS